MSHASDAFPEMGLGLGHLLVLLVTGLLAGCACWLTCYAGYLGWRKAREVQRKHRAGAAYRAEVSRGLAEIERFLQAHAARASHGDAADGDGDVS